MQALYTLNFSFAFAMYVYSLYSPHCIQPESPYRDGNKGAIKPLKQPQKE